MISQAIVNLGIVGLTYAILLLYLIRFVFRYKHQYESNKLCTSVVIFCLLVVLIATFVLPVDIFLVSYVKEPDGTFKEWATNATRASIDQAVYTAYYCKFLQLYVSKCFLSNSKPAQKLLTLNLNPPTKCFQ